MTCHDTDYEQRKNDHSGLDDCNCKSETKYHYKDNCEEYEGGSEIVINCPTDIKEAECVPILAQKIYDCVTAGCEHFLASDAIEFSIDCFEEDKYEDAAKICIDKVAISYDFLGADINNYYDTEPICTGKDEVGICARIGNGKSLFSAVPGSAYVVTGGGKTLYNKFVTVISPTTIKNNCKKGKATKTRLLTDPVSLYASNFKISVLGRIGCKKFSASAHLVDGEDYDAYNLANLTGGNNQNVYAKVNLPTNLTSSSIYMEFNHSISIDCISANDVFHESDYGVFTATLEGTLDMRTTFTPIVEEKLVVFTAPHGLECSEQESCGNEG